MKKRTFRFFRNLNFQFGENIEKNGCVMSLILNRIELLFQEVQGTMTILPPEQKKTLNIKKLYF